jgi:hypothetical protein
MFTQRRVATALVAATMLLGTAVFWTAKSGDATAGSADSRLVGPRPTGPDRTVTLLTGDRITVSGSGDERPRLSVDRAPGRERASFLTRWERGDLHVVPTDAAALLGSGRLDPRLFDVTRLLRADDDPPLVVGGDTRKVRPEGRAALWRDLVAGRVARVRLGEPATVEEKPDAETYELTVRFIDRAGRPAALNTAFVTGLDVDAREALYDVGGSVTVRLPRGTYQVGSFIPNGADDLDAGAMLVQPELDLTGPRTVVLDARLGKPVSITVPEPGAVPQVVSIGFADSGLDGAVGGELFASSLDRMYSAQIGGGAGADGFAGLVTAGFRASVDGDSPYVYHLAYYQRGRMWTGLDRRPRRRDLATVRVHHAQTVAGSTGYGFAFYELPGVPWGMRWTQSGTAGPMPRVATEYYNTDAGVRWDIAQIEQVAGEEYPIGVQSLYSSKAYQPGRVYREDWNKAVLAPAFPPTQVPGLWVTRTGDEMVIFPSWFSDAAGHEGSGEAEHAGYTIAVYRNGELIAEEDNDVGFPTVPADSGRYEVKIRAKRDKPYELSTRIEAAWTFDSGHVDGDTPVALPLSAVRFMPALDDRNAAPGGRVYPVPVVVSPQQGSAAGTLAELSVEASYDDGATWQPVELRRTADGGTALLRHPGGPGYVSLRASATDSAGNTVTQTVVRAYRLRAAA